MDSKSELLFNQEQPKRPGTCKKCGFYGHLAFQCMNHIKLDKAGEQEENYIEISKQYMEQMRPSKLTNDSKKIHKKKDKKKSKEKEKEKKKKDKKSKKKSTKKKSDASKSDSSSGE